MIKRKIHGFSFLTDGNGMCHFNKGWKAYRKDMQRTAFGEWSDTGMRRIKNGELGLAGLRRLCHESKLFFENEKGEIFLI